MLKIIICANKHFYNPIKQGLETYIVKKQLNTNTKIVLEPNSFQQLRKKVTQEVDSSEYITILSEFENENEAIENAEWIRKTLSNSYIIFVSENKLLLEKLTNRNVMLSGFVMFPFVDETFAKILDCVYSYYKSLNIEEPDKTLIIDVLDSNESRITVCVPFRELSHIEARDKKTLFYTKSKVYSNRMSLSSIIESKLNDRFYRCHNAFIVNLDKIAFVNYPENIITMTTGEIVYISRAKKAELKEILDTKSLMSG